MARPARIAEADLVEAAVRVVADRGLDALSVRSVAREAGVSAGAVQHHFPTVDALLEAAYRRVIGRVTARVVALPPTESQKAFARSLLMELLPLDEDRRTELSVALAFSARAIHSPGLAELYAEGYRALVVALEGALEHAVAQGEAAPGVDPRRDAVALAALADGLAWHLIGAPAELAADEAARAVDARMDALFPA